MEKTVKVYFDGQRESGAYVQNAMVLVNEDYTMSQLVRKIKEDGFVSFCLPSMKRLVKICDCNY